MTMERFAVEILTLARVRRNLKALPPPARREVEIWLAERQRRLRSSPDYWRHLFAFFAPAPASG